MATDIRLDEGDGTFLVLASRVVKTEASDFMLDSAQRRRSAGGNRRALVHDQNDGLTMNFNGDYPGGVTLVKVVEIVPRDAALAVRGAITYETEQLVGDKGQGAIEGETHTITVNIDELFNAHQSEIVALRARIEALEAKIAG
jgi:hypothetical protein